MSATPQTVMAPDDPGRGLRLVLPGRHEPAGSGWTWIVDGWRLFRRAPVMWIVSVLLVVVAAILLSLIPVVGSLAFQALNAVIVAGFVVACRSLETGGDFDLEHLFAGFRVRFVPLLVVGLLVLAGWIVIMLVFAGFVGFSILTAVSSSASENITAMILNSTMSILLGVLVATALSVPLLAAFWFAPPLVVMHGLGAGAAMKASFSACFRNFGAFLVYGIVMTLFALVAAIPFGLGFLVWVPVAIASSYAAYRRIYTDEALPGPAVTLGG